MQQYLQSWQKSENEFILQTFVMIGFNCTSIFYICRVLSQNGGHGNKLNFKKMKKKQTFVDILNFECI